MKRLCAAGLVAVALTGCGAGEDRTGVMILPDMAASVPYDAYASNPATATGQTLLLPPEGTVPMGFEPFPYGATPEEAERAGRELTNPLRPTAADLRRGAVEYGNKCQVCHGDAGEGDGPIIGRFPNPPNLKAEHAKRLADGHLYHIISRGQGIMPSHAVQVLPEDRWRLVLYVRQLQGLVSAVADTDEEPSDG